MSLFLFLITSMAVVHFVTIGGISCGHVICPLWNEAKKERRIKKSHQQRPRNTGAVATRMEPDTSALKPMETTTNAKETTSTASKSASKSSTSSIGSSSTDQASKPHKEADLCCVCLEDLQVDSHTFSRMTCCGKAVHLHCKDNFFGSSLSREQKGKCPHCQV